MGRISRRVKQINVLLGSKRYDKRDGSRGEVVAIRNMHVVLRLDRDGTRRSVPNGEVRRRHGKAGWEVLG